MKHFIYILIAFCCSSSLITSCDDWSMLEEHPKKIDATTFMSNANEVQGVINSIYYQIRRNPGFGRYLSIFSESLADYCYGRGSYATSYSTGLTSAGIGFTKDTWAVLYRSIRFSNEIMSEIGKSSLTKLQYEQLTGEARFLRAFCYSYLVKYYGAVPLFTESNMSDFNKPRTDEKTIWEYIKDEAKYASENLPETVQAAGHPTKYSALMLLAEANLYLKNWSDAADNLNEIISSKRYSLVEVSCESDFNNLYGYDINSSSEEIFYIKYNRDDGATFPWMFLSKPNPVFNTGALGIYTDYASNQFIANWDKNDLRYKYSLFVQTQNGTLNGLTKTGMICLKYRDTETNGSTMANDYPIYRYADAMLYYAEAICRRDGKPNQQAMEMINQIHRRAYGLNSTTVQANDYKLADYPSEESFMELVLKERGYETIFEGKRYCDLKRCGLLAEYALRAGRITSKDEVKEAAYYWPIPTDEFNYNTALDPTVDQNPGY